MPITKTMNILVCIKQVATAPDGKTFAMNRFDEYALEEAVRIKEQLLEKGHEAMVDVVSLGRKKAAEVIKRALGIGADNGFHIVVEQKLSSAVTAELIHRTFGTLPSYDLVLTGMISQDNMEGQTGQILAELMGIACSSGVVEIFLDSNSPDIFDIRVERELDRGSRESLSITLPALLTVQAGINTPRYPTLSNLLRAGTRPITTFTVPQETLPRADQTVLRLVEPAKSRSGTIIGGTTAEKAEELFSILRKRGIL